jgi:hypothetical protein
MTLGDHQVKDVAVAAFCSIALRCAGAIDANSVLENMRELRSQKKKAAMNLRPQA